MQDRLSRLESLLDQQSRAVQNLERRLASLEERFGAHPRPEPRRTTGPDGAPDPVEDLLGEDILPSGSQLRSYVPLAGRALVALGGAYLLRAITDHGLVPVAVGMALGLGYALLWTVLAYLAGPRNSSSAAVHAVTSVTIAFPLLWEATTRSALLSPPASAAAVVATALVGLGVGWRRRLPFVAWVFVLGGLATGVALPWATRALLPFTYGLLVFGVAVLWVCYDRRWRGLSGFTAAVVDLQVLLLTALIWRRPSPGVEALVVADSVIPVQLVLVFGYLGSIGMRTLIRGRDLISLEVVQTIVVLTVGLGGALAAAYHSGAGTVWIGLVSAVLGLAFYGISFAVIDWRPGARRNFIYYTSLAFTFTGVAGFVFFAGDPLALVFAGLSLLTAWLGGQFSRVTLTLHSAAYALAAGIVVGLPELVADSLVGRIEEARRWMSFPVIATLATVASSCFLWAPSHGRTWGRFARVPKCVLLMILVCGLFGLGVEGGALVFGGPNAEAIDEGILAVLRTGALAVCALLIAFAGRQSRFSEASWLVYPLLVVGAVKLLVEDLPHGRPETLFGSFAMFGSALILAPWLGRKKSREPSEA